MMDISIVRQSFSSMTDDQLLVFAKFESSKLTAEAFQLLREEFEKRNLDFSVLESSEIDKELENLQKQTTFERITAFEFTETLWRYALDEKAAGKTDYEIFNGLVAKGVDEDYAYMLIQSIESKAKELADNYDTEMLTGAGSIIIGFIVLVWTVTSTSNPVLFFFGVSAIVLGIIRAFKGESKKRRYETIVSNIAKERDEKQVLKQ